MFDNRNQLVFYANILIMVFGLSVIVMSDFITVALLFIVCGALLIFEQIKQNKGAFRISGLEKTLTIDDTCGTQAILTQKQSTIACHVDNTVFCFKNITPSGSISNFSINGQSPVEQKKDSNNNYQVCMVLPNNPRATNGLETVLKYKCKDAFVRSDGILTHTVDDETDKLRLIVELPKGRRISTARSYCVVKGKEIALLPPLVMGETRIETEISNPIQGAQYCLHWNWPEANLLKKITCLIK